MNPWAMAENLKERTMVIATDLGCPTNDSLTMIKCMRNRPAEHIISLHKKFVVTIICIIFINQYNLNISVLLISIQIFIFNFQVWGNMFPLAVFTPVIELPSATAFISDTPVNIIKNKLGSDVPTILSYALDDGLCGAGGKADSSYNNTS